MTYFHDESIIFTSDELGILQDVLRRAQPGGLFTGQPEYAEAAGKIMHARPDVARVITRASGTAMVVIGTLLLIERLPT